MTATMIIAEPATLAATIDRLREQQRVPGLAVAAATAGTLLWSHASGWADLEQGAPFTPATACHWFSMTKVVTVTVAMALADGGALDLDAPVRRYLPGVLADGFSGVRVRHLANHSAGLTNPLPLRWVHPAGRPIPNQGEFLARQLSRQRAPRFTPGSKASYTNVGTVLLGEVVARVSGRPFVDVVRTEVLTPLGMARTGFTYAETHPAPAAIGYQRLPHGMRWALERALPAGTVGRRYRGYVGFNPFEMDAPACSGLIGPVTDAARFLSFHLAGGEVGDRRLLSGASVAAMQDINLPGRPFDLGLGWFRRHGERRSRADYVEHLGGGGGFWNVLRLYPGLGVGVAVMGNTTHHYDVGAIADAVAMAATTTE
jgi:CubicO group peptidase (beta-lactamase class C family)